MCGVDYCHVDAVNNEQLIFSSKFISLKSLWKFHSNSTPLKSSVGRLI